MQDAINLLMLVCAGLAALALGVLMAYAMCRAAFAALRMHARSVAAEAPAKTQIVHTSQA
ncbi:hypothetical protein [Paracidobacterium acidisoli]|uniref:hypothetical protein n=1 Tax=Paracidobacterium acidisoli TaxID=2303751 RepID=UPI000E3E5D6E|nr:hypothetical protein [Paracidobacterium acidisoli]MBT9329654.1 hypothetical protein [Paracidobacterium acidisoli]